MFIIVRHGNTFTTDELPRRIGARTDVPLTDVGHNQAHALGNHFTALNWHFGRVLVSPLLRTRQTAEAIISAQPHRIMFETADFLGEIDHGPDENQTEDDVEARIGTQALAEWDAHGVPPPGWLVDAEARIAAWQSLLATATKGNRPTLLVTSNGAARFALLAAPALRACLGNLPTLKLPTGGYGVIRRAAHGSLELPVWGQRP